MPENVFCEPKWYHLTHFTSFQAKQKLYISKSVRPLVKKKSDSTHTGGLILLKFHQNVPIT